MFYECSPLLRLMINHTYQNNWLCSNLSRVLVWIICLYEHERFAYKYNIDIGENESNPTLSSIYIQIRHECMQYL